MDTRLVSTELLSLIAIVNSSLLKRGRGPSENVEKAPREIENFKIPIYLSLLCSCPFDMLCSCSLVYGSVKMRPLNRHILQEKGDVFFFHSDVITHLAYMLYILPSLPSCYLNIPIHDFEKKSNKETNYAMSYRHRRLPPPGKMETGL